VLTQERLTESPACSTLDPTRQQAQRGCSRLSAVELQGQCLLFSQVPVDALSCIQAVVEVIRCPRAHTIFREGDRASGFFIVRSGWTKVFRKHPDGRKTIQGIAGPGHVLGLVEVLTGSRLQSSAQALDEERSVRVVRRCERRASRWVRNQGRGRSSDRDSAA